MPKKLATTIYITEKQQKQLKELNESLKVPVSEMIRQGIDLILKKYNETAYGQMPLPLSEEEDFSEEEEEEEDSKK